MHAADALPFVLVAFVDLIALIWLRQWRRRQRMTKRMVSSLSAAIHREMAGKASGQLLTAR